MHLLAAQPGEIQDGSEAIDLGQDPADIIFLTAADTELSAMAAAYDQIKADFPPDQIPSLRLANVMQLSHPMSVDLYLDQTLRGAKIVMVRLLGGAQYWSYGVTQLRAQADVLGYQLVFVPGDPTQDPDLMSQSTLSMEAVILLWQACVQGGVANLSSMICHLASLIGYDLPFSAPQALPVAGLLSPGIDKFGQMVPDLSDLADIWSQAGLSETAPKVMITFYRAHLQAGTLAPIESLCQALMTRGMAPLPLYLTSLKDPVAADVVRALIEQSDPAVILNCLAFSVASPTDTTEQISALSGKAPVFQVIQVSTPFEKWQENPQGLVPRDIAMHVALPEVDGRILTRAISFKAAGQYHQDTQCGLVTLVPHQSGIDYVAETARHWARLQQTPVAEKQIAILLANYPNRDGRLANGVGLDSPAATIEVIQAMKAAGYHIEKAPETVSDLMADLQKGVSNQQRQGRLVEISLSAADYQKLWHKVDPAFQNMILARWGDWRTDPFFNQDQDRFDLPLHQYGHLVIGIQPARGYQIDPEATYHDPDLPPPHGYLACYFWLCHVFQAHALIHMGKHGNLEWLPGKALALSDSCAPQAVLPPIPHFYPFIVNDPGEGSQAKRRTAAVILDHLTPPLTRAETYGPLQKLEQLVDEYYEAAGLDPRRLPMLKQDILAHAAQSGLDQDLGLTSQMQESEALSRLDAHLCDLKELQIRDGLHIFGQSPTGTQLYDLALAIARTPRGLYLNAAMDPHPGMSLLQALSYDLGLQQAEADTLFDPLSAEFEMLWTGQRPQILANLSESVWRHEGDSVERLELLSQHLIRHPANIQPDWQRTQKVMGWIQDSLLPLLQRCGAAETDALLAGLAGRAIAPGPSGAPSRGRPEVLPTGRNFFSVDTRSVPTASAWSLGWKSAQLLMETYAQEHGNYPKKLVLSAWGTANMRTGGEDIAQALALMGVQPEWDSGSGRVSGFKILPLSVLDRPRVDVTLRVSGFFRDAFPGLMDLFASAVAAVSDLAESPSQNPLAAQIAADQRQAEQQGLSPDQARQQAQYRIFGSKPGAYGAGLQALIDEKIWQDDQDFAQAFLAWGSFAYGQGAGGVRTETALRDRLSDIDVVLHNQDNREHDILDSDDYYQFQGGLTATVRHLSGQTPTVYHGDHARPENPKIRPLAQEIARVVRGRAANPKWIEGVMRHQYKGAFEIVATVDYLFAYAATTRLVPSHHFDLLYQAYLEDIKVHAFLAAHNPAGLAEMKDRFREALDRGLWQPRRNAVFQELMSEQNQGLNGHTDSAEEG